MPLPRLTVLRSAAVVTALLSLCGGKAFAASQAEPAPLWGAIATVDGLYGYAYDQPTSASAENAARAQCERKAGRTGTCVVRTTFNRACGAMATGNFGEWGVASAPTIAAARKEATAQCDSHLPTEPCKVMVAVCSGQPQKK
ncbi:MAG: DUF4189 domain-containing protein [Proteobacteria bacterium]|nr:DUF4189 domain-containing protein [Pseudomonadota bacterium]